MKIQLATVIVDDQDKALKFYTEVLGFMKKAEMPIGGSTWVTVASPDAPESIELALEPSGFLPSKAYQKSLFEAGSPAISIATDDFQAEYERLKALGVTFRGELSSAEPMTSTLFEDTCGNLIRLYRATDSPV